LVWAITKRNLSPDGDNDSSALDLLQGYLVIFPRGCYSAEFLPPEGDDDDFALDKLQEYLVCFQEAITNWNLRLGWFMMTVLH
jgi:hypothetical protein